MSEGNRVVARRSAEEWRAILSRFERSGQGHRDFCLAEGLAPSTFALWRRKLGRASPKCASGDAALFVELTEGRPAAAWDAELDLGGGVVLRVRRPGPC